jgi:hypothetical protein
VSGFKIPSNVTTPVVAALGVNPVVPALNVVTPQSKKLIDLCWCSAKLLKLVL